MISSRTASRHMILPRGGQKAGESTACWSLHLMSHLVSTVWFWIHLLKELLLESQESLMEIQPGKQHCSCLWVESEHCRHLVEPELESDWRWSLVKSHLRWEPGTSTEAGSERHWQAVCSSSEMRWRSSPWCSWGTARGLSTRWCSSTERLPRPRAWPPQQEPEPLPSFYPPSMGLIPLSLSLYSQTDVSRTIVECWENVFAGLWRRLGNGGGLCRGNWREGGTYVGDQTRPRTCLPICLRKS